jgi:hypothetical protein
VCAQIGVALIDQARITEGTAFHDEAMAGALAGEGLLDTVVFTAYKMLISYTVSVPSTSDWHSGYRRRTGSWSATSSGSLGTSLTSKPFQAKRLVASPYPDPA